MTDTGRFGCWCRSWNMHTVLGGACQPSLNVIPACTPAVAAACYVHGARTHLFLVSHQGCASLSGICVCWCEILGLFLRLFLCSGSSNTRYQYTAHMLPRHLNGAVGCSKPHFGSCYVARDLWGHCFEGMYGPVPRTQAPILGPRKVSPPNMLVWAFALPSWPPSVSTLSIIWLQRGLRCVTMWCEACLLLCSARVKQLWCSQPPVVFFRGSLSLPAW
jgi:hypothetical protein